MDPGSLLEPGSILEPGSLGEAGFIAAAIRLLASNQTELQQLQTEEIHRNIDFQQRKFSNATI